MALLPKQIQEQLKLKKNPDQNIGPFAFKYLLNKLLERVYSDNSRLIGSNPGETSMLGQEQEQEQFNVVDKLRAHYCGQGKDWKQCEESLEKALKELQQYIVEQIINLAKETASTTGDTTNYSDIDKPEAAAKRKFLEKEQGTEIGKYKSALRLLLDSNTEGWSSLFHTGSTVVYRGKAPFRSLLGLYWLAACDSNPGMGMGTTAPEIATNLTLSKQNFVEVMSEIRRAHNEGSTSNATGDNPSCPQGSFGRVVSSSVIYNEMCKIKFNPHTSQELKLGIEDFIIAELHKMKRDDRIRIGKFLSDEAIFLMGEESDREFVLEKFINKFLGMAPWDSKTSEELIGRLIAFLEDKCVDLKFIFSKMREGSLAQQLRANIKEMLMVHLASLYQPRVVAPDERLIRTILIDSFNSCLEDGLKIKKKAEIEKGLQQLRSYVYEMTLEVNSLNQELHHEYTKMMLYPSYYLTGLERIEHLVMQAQKLEADYQAYYWKTVKKFEGMVTDVMLDMMKNGELPGISESYEAKIKNELDNVINRVAKSVLTKTTLDRMEACMTNLKSMKGFCDLKLEQIVEGLPLLPNEARAAADNKKFFPYGQNPIDWAKYFVALALRPVKQLEMQGDRLTSDLSTLEVQINTLSQDRITNKAILQVLNARKDEVQTQLQVIKQNYDQMNQSDFELMEDLLELSRQRFRFDRKEITAFLACFLTQEDTLNSLNKMDKDAVSKIKVLLKKYQYNIEQIEEAALSTAKRALANIPHPQKEEKQQHEYAKLFFYGEELQDFRQASLEMTQGSRYIKKENVVGQDGENAELALDARTCAEARRKVRIAGREQVKSQLTSNLEQGEAFRKKTLINLDPIDWLQVQVVVKANELKAKLERLAIEQKGLADNIESTSLTLSAASSRFIRPQRGVRVVQGRFIGRFIQKDDIQAYRERVKKAKEREVFEVQEYKKYLENFNQERKHLEQYGYAPLTFPIPILPMSGEIFTSESESFARFTRAVAEETRILQDYAQKAYAALKQLQDTAIEALENAEIGSFRITAGVVPNQFWIIGKSADRIHKISVYINDNGFCVRNEEGRTIFAVPSFEQLRRQVLLHLNPKTPKLSEQLPVKRKGAAEPVDTKGNREPIQGLKQLFIFDFDKSLVYIHWHAEFKKTKMARGYPSKFDMLTDDFSKDSYIRFREKMTKALREILNQGHHIAITSFSKYPGIIRSVLRELGLTDDEINTKVYLPETNLFEEEVEFPDGKNSMIKDAMDYFNIQHYSQVTVVDDEKLNRYFANQLKGSKSTAELGMTILNPVSTLEGEPGRNYINRVVINHFESHSPCIFLEVIMDKLNPEKQQKAEEMNGTIKQLRAALTAAIDKGEANGVLGILFGKIKDLPIHEHEKIKRLTQDAFYQVIQKGNYEILKQFLIHFPSCFNDYDLFAIVCLVNCRDRRTFGYASQALVLAIQSIENAVNIGDATLIIDAVRVYHELTKTLLELRDIDDLHDQIIASQKYWEQQTGKKFNQFMIGPEQIASLAKNKIKGPLLFSKSKASPPPPGFEAKISEPKSPQEQLMQAIEKCDHIQFCIALGRGGLLCPHNKPGWEYEPGGVFKNEETIKLMEDPKLREEIPFYRIIQTGNMQMINAGIPTRFDSINAWQPSFVVELSWHDQMEKTSLWRVLDRLKMALDKQNIEEFDTAHEILDWLKKQYDNQPKTSWWVTEYSKPKTPLTFEDVAKKWCTKKRLNDVDALRIMRAKVGGGKNVAHP